MIEGTARLKAIVARATPGLWYVGKSTGHAGYNLYDSEGCDVTDPGANLDMDDAIFMATFNPALVSALLDELERWRSGEHP